MSNSHYQKHLDQKQSMKQGVEAHDGVPAVAPEKKQSTVTHKLPGSTLNQSVVVELVIFSVIASTLSCLGRYEGSPTPLEDSPKSLPWTLPFHVQDEREPVSGVAEMIFKEVMSRDVPYTPKIVGVFDRPEWNGTLSILYFVCCSPDDVYHSVRLGSNGWTGTDFAKMAGPAPMIEAALERLRFEASRGPIATQLLASQFTLSEMQVVTELVTGEQLDKRNFRKQVVEADWVEETGEFRRGQHQPAKLYRARPRSDNALQNANIVLP